MVYLAQSQYLLLLLIVPLLFVAYALYLRARRKRLARFGNPELVSQLMPPRARAGSRSACWPPPGSSS